MNSDKTTFEVLPNGKTKALTTKTGKTIAHGTASSYINHRCRCEPCTKAHGQRHLEAAYAAQVKGIPADAVHGTENVYTYYGCRCVPCVENKTQKSSERRRAKLKIVLPPKVRHGSYAALDAGCGCKQCHALKVRVRSLKAKEKAEAKAEAKAAYQASRVPATLTKNHQHGEVTSYTVDGCRCHACTESYRVYRAERRLLRLVFA